VRIAGSNHNINVRKVAEEALSKLKLKTGLLKTATLNKMPFWSKMGY